MKKRMKQFMSLFLAVSMVFSMSLTHVHAAPVDEVVSEQSEIMESTVVEDEGEALPEEEKQTEATQEEKQEEKQTKEKETEEKEAAEVEVEEVEEVEETEETQPQTTTTAENTVAYTVNTEDIDVSGVTPYSISVEDEVEVDETNPITATIEEELGEIKVLDEEGKSVALTEDQIQQILYVWEQYQEQCKENANLLGVQQPFFLSYNDKNEDGLGVLGEMLVLAGYSVDDVRSGKYKFDDLMGMIQNFLYADKFAVKLYGDAIAAKRDEALKAVEKSGAKTMAQKLLVLNDWIAHQATFDMAYIMKGDTDGDGEQDDPLMVAENPQKHQYYDTIYDEMYKLYEDQIRKQFRDQIAAGIKDAVYQQALEQANAAHNDIYEQVYQKLLDSGMEDNEETAAIAEQQTQEQIKKIAEDAVDDVVKNGMPATDEDGKPITDEEGNQVKVPFETVIDQQMDQQMDELGGMTPNQAIPVYAEQAATGLTQGILGAWEGNHVGILAEGKGVCAGYSKALSYLLQYMSPEYYAKDGATDMSVSSNWKTPEALYYDEDGNLDVNQNYIVDMVRITFDAETSMFGETGMFGEVHFWNAVKINKQWYYVDPCYTDIYVECMSRDRVEIDGTMNHMYFLFSDDTARELYDGNMKEIAGLYNGVATDKSYEDSWFARISSNAYSDGKNFYYLYDSTDQLSMMREFNNMDSDNMNSEDWEALMEGSDPDYKIVYHEMTDTDKSGGADSDFTTLINFNPKDDDDNTLSALVYDPESGDMVENELLTYLFAKYKDECDIYPSIKLTTALYDGKLYFNLSNCILSYELSTGNVSIVKEYDKVSGKRDNTNPFGGMAFTTCSESEADFTFTNRPIAAMTIKEDGKMYVSVATNLGFISGKETVNDISNYGYEYEESNYNPDYSNYAQDSDYSDEELADMGFSKETNDNDEFMWSAVFVDTISMSGMCTDHNYESVTETFCGRDGYTENRCTKCGAVEDGSRVVNEGTSFEHHYLHFEEQYYTKNDNGAWNTGDCYVCTVCGFSIEEPEEPKKNQQETQEEFEERQAEYEKEKAIYDHAVETAGHTYEAKEENVKWSEDNSTATVSGEATCTVCEDKKLDVLGANQHDPKADANADNSVLSVTLEDPIELAAEEGSKTVTGTCDTGLTINYTANGTTEDGKKLVAKKTETTEAGRHAYEAEFTWSDNAEEESTEEGTETEAEDETAEVPYTATADIECSACHHKVTGLETTVSLDEENSEAAACEKAGKNVYKATATYTEGKEAYTFEDSKEDVIDEIGHNYVGEITWTEKTNEEGKGTGEWDATAVFTCQNDSEHKLEGEAVEVTVDKKTTDATCDKAGKVTYTATAKVKDNETIDPVTDTKEVEVAALGHDYDAKDAAWKWTEAEGEVPHKATLTLTCSRCADKQTLEGKVEPVSQKAATCDEDGEDVYKATATYNGKEYTDTHKDTHKATGHTYADDEEHVKWTWSEDYKEASLVLTCTTCGKATDAIKAEVKEETTDATCTEAGTTVYTATAEYEGKTYTAKETVTGKALGHEYKEEWKWTEAAGEDPHKATLTLTCSRCDDKQTLEGKVEPVSQKAATCDEDGEDVYTATVTYNGKEYTDTHKDTHEATGHSYVDDKDHVEWTWSKDHKEASVVLTCTTCGKKTASIDAKVTIGSTDATCTEAGTTVYTATATYEGKTYTAEETVNGEALGHDYTAEWSWTEAAGEVPHKATLTLTCSRGDDKQTLDGKVEVVSQKAATCEEDGADEYKATVSYNGKPYTDTHKDTHKATGHDLKSVKPVFKWSADNTSCTAEYKCKACEKIIAKECEVEIIQKDATYQSSGSIVCTATCDTDSETKSITLNQLDSEAKLNASSYAAYSTQRITSQITSKDPDDKIVSIQSSDPKKLAVTASGKKIAFKAAKVTKTTKVKVTAITASGKKLTATVTIKPTKVTLTATSVPLQLKKSTTAVKIKSKTYSADKVAKWSTSNKKIATVSSSGKITAKKTGTVTITLTMTSGATAKCKVKVQKSAVKITKLSISDSKVTLKLKGGAKTYQIKTAKTPITVTSKVTYTSSNKKVATVSSSGKITAKKAGKATITVKCSGKSRKIAVTVKSK